MAWRAPRLSVRVRFALPVVLAISLVGFTAAFMVRRAVHRTLSEELADRSQATVAELALRVTPDVLRDDLVGIEGAVDDIEARRDVRYVVVIDAAGEVLASSFSAGVPTDLALLFARPRPDEQALLFRTEGGLVKEHVASLVGGRLGVVHLGVEQNRVEALADDQSRLILTHTLAGAALAGLLALLTAHLVTGPLRQLAQVAGRVGTDVPAGLMPSERNDEVGDLARAFGSMVERLAQKQAQVDAANRLVVQAERLAVVGKLASGVAHEIGNPLHAGRQFLEALKERPEQAERYLGLLDQAFARIDGVIGQLLAYSAERRLAPELAQVREVVTKAVEFLRYDHRLRRVELRVEIPDTLPAAVLDTDALHQVLVNLVVNALDALDGEGAITIAARAEDQQVVLSVRDTGPGVSPDIAAHLFDPFFTTKEPGRGTGLGLSVSQELVSAMGGRLLYALGEAPGACFEIWLPLEVVA